MWEFLQRLFIGHAHRWETIKEVPLTTYHDLGTTHSTRYYCKCSICGKHKKFN